MTKEDDYLIDLEDTTLVPEGERKAPVEKAKPVERDPAADSAIESMRAQLRAMEDERNTLATGKAEAERIAREQAEIAARASGQAARSHYDMVQGHISAANSAISSLKQQIRLAREANDFDKETDLQSQFMKASTRLLQYEDEKADIEARAERARNTKPEAPKAPERPSDPVEAYVQNLSRESQGWLRSHRECVTDPELNAKVVWGHQQALKKGLRADSPEYFSYLDEHMGYAQPKHTQAEAEDEGDEVEIVESKPEPKRSMPSAPVSRTGNAKPGQTNGNKVRLTREQVDMAEAMGMSPAEYAKNLVELTKNGRYPNVYN